MLEGIAAHLAGAITIRYDVFERHGFVLTLRSSPVNIHKNGKQVGKKRTNWTMCNILLITLTAKLDIQGTTQNTQPQNTASTARCAK